MLRVVAVAALGLLPYYVAAQNTTKATCLAGFSWSFNSEGDSPCDVAMALAGVCIGTDFTLAPLQPGFVYLGPNVANANSCRCSSVYYSLLSACAACQDRSFIKSGQRTKPTVALSILKFLDPIHKASWYLTMPILMSK
ncbi:hypothetical protein BDZ97DRAFT_1792997 [Flammula alnicola]|nr:hypothetical protein BDZ97DRAFT_1792997 [Flammula alnicola]